MFSSSLLSGVRTTRTSFIFKRNLAAAAPTDPIQKLFLEKIREYKQKSVDGKLVDPNPDIERQLKSEQAKLEKRHGGGPNVDMSAFPQFTFDEPKLDPIDEVVATASAKKKQ